MGIRDIKRKVRRHLHSRAKVPAYYIAATGAEPKLVHVRIHSKWNSTTMDTPTNSGSMVERQTIFPKILFMRDELAAQGIKLRRKGIISVEAGEAYSLDNSEPVDDISVSWIVTQMDEGEAEALPYPDQTGAP